MQTKHLAIGIVLLCCGLAPDAYAENTYPAMAPVTQYLIANRADEIALARSAAPASISGDATILTLGSHGFETAVTGKNGFVCFVERSWDSDFDAPEFWNWHIRGPDCFNAAAVRSVVPEYLERAKWVLAGASKAVMIARTKAAFAAKTFVAPEPGAMCFMMSKQQYLSDNGGEHGWHPHLMFFVPHTEPAEWGADAKGSPVIAGQMNLEHVTIMMVPVAKWSDGTSAVMEMK
jgi:hypothetical protein